MADIHTSEGLNYWNGLLSNNLTPSNIEFRIYTNEVTLSNTLTFADFTELSHPDYSAYITSPGDWTYTVVGGQLSHPEIQWKLNSGGVSIVGILITVDGTLFYATELDAYVSQGSPITVTEAGAIIYFSYSHQVIGAQN